MINTKINQFQRKCRITNHTNTNIIMVNINMNKVNINMIKVNINMNMIMVTQRIECKEITLFKVIINPIIMVDKVVIKISLSRIIINFPINNTNNKIINNIFIVLIVLNTYIMAIQIMIMEDNNISVITIYLQRHLFNSMVQQRQCIMRSSKIKVYKRAP